MATFAPSAPPALSMVFSSSSLHSTIYKRNVLSFQAIDLSSFFWDLIEQIVKMSSSDFMQSEYFAYINMYVEQKRSFILTIDQQTFQFDSIENLFYRTKEYLFEKQIYPFHFTLLDAAINKMNAIMAQQDKPFSF